VRQGHQGAEQMKSDLVDIACFVRMETMQAYLIDAGTGKEIWVPKSQVEITDKDESTLWNNRTAKIATMPEWLAKDKGLI
jgi:predicted secreted protein